MRHPALAALLLVAALPAAAETYKWVDANGVVNYSNTPPPAAGAGKAVQVEDRISTYQSDPGLRQAAAASAARSAQMQASADAEWLQRQRLMAMKDAYDAAYSYPDEYYPSYYPGYYYPGYAAYPAARARAVRTAFKPVVTPHGAGMPARSSGAPRGGLMR